MKETMLFGCVSVVLGIGLVVLSLLMMEDRALFGIGILSGTLIFTAGLLLLVLSPLRGTCPHCGAILLPDARGGSTCICNRPSARVGVTAHGHHSGR